MKRLKILYSGHSFDFSAPGDRRRIIRWAAARNHEIVTEDSSTVDVKVITSSSNLSEVMKQKKSAPIILDLVDAYHVGGSPYSDFLIAIHRSFKHRRLLSSFSFSNFLDEVMDRVDYIVFSSPEQRNLASFHFDKSTDILDFHDEFPELSYSPPKKDRLELFWEGQTTSLRALDDNIDANSSDLKSCVEIVNVLTDPSTGMLFGKFIKTQTEAVFPKLFFSTSVNVQRQDWNLKKVNEVAQRSNLSLVPVLSDPLNLHKPENRILIAWRMGLPVLASNTPSHQRLSITAQADFCVESNWVEQICNLNKNRDLLEEQVFKGKKYLAQHHNTEVILAKWDALFAKVV